MRDYGRRLRVVGIAHVSVPFGVPLGVGRPAQSEKRGDVDAC